MFSVIKIILAKPSAIKLPAQKSETCLYISIILKLASKTHIVLQFSFQFIDFLKPVSCQQHNKPNPLDSGCEHQNDKFDVYKTKMISYQIDTTSFYAQRKSDKIKTFLLICRLLPLMLLKVVRSNKLYLDQFKKCEGPDLPCP